MDFKVGDMVTFHVEVWAREGPAIVTKIYLPPHVWTPPEPVIGVRFRGIDVEYHFWECDLILFSSDYDEIMEMQAAYESVSR